MTKKQAFQEAKAQRAAGKNVKVVHVSGVYTQPGRGIVAYSHYEVRSI